METCKLGKILPTSLFKPSSHALTSLKLALLQMMIMSQRVASIPADLSLIMPCTQLLLQQIDQPVSRSILT